MTSMTAEELLTSDIGLWEIHSMRERNADGSFKVYVRDGCYPEGWDSGPIQVRLVGDSPRQLITAWHSFVRNQINAWQNRKEAEAAKRAETSGASSKPPDTAARELEGSSQADPPAGAESEASLEQILESKVASLSRSVARIEEQIAETLRSLGVLRERRTAELSSARRASAALKAATTGRVRSKRREGTGMRGKKVRKFREVVEGS